ncbi:hypothetical protein LN040_05340 [Desulfovibrio subterraneus]|jgi:hypothetical protein|uniref:Muconolactone isomerase domain-containing protein n=1 Tax=Desulfovibrio subterraneus TaxID=2718620 RepID=A0A7J0BL74_9BACT|nr:hypothetical protein [Desulfovibrio subterraneus]WBF68529.1 hypothetical protein LN040_05340 [Desulfovibrio subterraneus]GFM34493.1 hypothetical protein DSM101010T_28580 [Desulfovibrio subterraneus]
MKILALDRVLETATPEGIKGNFMKEVNQMVKLYLADVVREIYFRQDRSGTVLIMEAATLEDARNMIDTLPLVKSKMIDFDLIPLGPFMPLALLLDEEEEAPAAGSANCH